MNGMRKVSQSVYALLCHDEDLRFVHGCSTSLFFFLQLALCRSWRFLGTKSLINTLPDIGNIIVAALFLTIHSSEGKQTIARISISLTAKS